MPVNKEIIEEVRGEMKRLEDRLNAIELLWEKQKSTLDSSDPDRREYMYFSSYPAETGAIKRASMDLTRSLVKLRKPESWRE